MPLESVERAAQTLCRAAEESGWRGPDIYDALWGRWPKAMTAGRRRRQALIQLHSRSPIDLRRLYRREHPQIAKALAVFALAEFRLHKTAGGDRGLKAAEKALCLLNDDREAGEDAWGYPWDMQTRWSYYPRGTANVVVTAFSGRAMAEGSRTLGVPGYEERAMRAALWVQRELFVEDLGTYAYHPGSRSVIHNANLLGARLAWEQLGDDDAVRSRVARAIERTLAAQRGDGAFPYGEGAGLGFVDSFHTGYVLECMCALSEVDPLIEGALERGAAFYRDRFFDRSGRSVLWPERRYPEDAHSAGTGLTTLALLARRGLADRTQVELVADRAVRHMIKGAHAIHRRYRFGPTRVTYLRWADAHLALGLANAGIALRRRTAPTPA